jgi:hypothetical protein
LILLFEEVFYRPVWAFCFHLIEKDGSFFSYCNFKKKNKEKNACQHISWFLQTKQGRLNKACPTKKANLTKILEL